jgi:hypothetical protein
MALFWICQPSWTNHVFHILGESGLAEKSNHLRPIYLSEFFFEPVRANILLK